MDALSIIDRGPRTLETASPTKKAGKSEQNFSKELNQKQQSQESTPVEHQAVDRQSKMSVNSEEKKTVADNHKAEKKQEKTGQTESTTETAPQQQVKMQQTLVDLMQTLKAVTDDISTEKSEGTVKSDDFDHIEKLLTDLVQQLDAANLPGEQVLAGVDLSSLATELESLNNDADHKELLVQLVTAIEEQITNETGLQENAELAAAMVVETQQQNVSPVVTENLAQTRQLLQKALDSVVSQKSTATNNAVTEERVAVTEQPTEEIVFAVKESSKEIDPRFAGLLKQRNDQNSVQKVPSGKEQTPLHSSSQQAELKQEEQNVQVPTAEIATKVETTQLSEHGSKQVFENMVQQNQHSLHSQGQPLTQGLETNKLAPQTPVVQLASGQQIPESQIFDQVVTHLSGSVNGDTGRMVLRLQPAELGSLRLELIVEGDRIQANLHAQSHQVQEVLERNLPQLRHALAEQGLKIDQFQVNVDQRQQSGQFENLAQQQHRNGSEKQPDWHQQNTETEEQIIPLAHLMQNGGRGISLHV
ncbi:MAG: flagellar hook-length control protein FliK [Desulfuromusa sp.]|jgi:flagellar hook-length control protein FliK|nr:flagellar hook-length control protein FliK [Desulfuromusa sp.]